MGNKHDQRPAAAIAGISAQLEGFDRLFRHGLRGKRWLEGGERSAAHSYAQTFSENKVPTPTQHEYKIPKEKRRTTIQLRARTHTRVV